MNKIRIFYKLAILLFFVLSCSKKELKAVKQVPEQQTVKNKTINPNAERDIFSEYKFTAENTPQFNSFMIKVVMTSTSQAKPPRIKNFRSIALRSFEIE